MRIPGFTHNLFHKHAIAGKDGLGRFYICEGRAPWAKAHVSFVPDLEGAGSHCVPPTDEDENGDTLLLRMISAGSAEEAMAMLRQVAGSR
jgi:hypothetical protein